MGLWTCAHDTWLLSLHLAGKDRVRLSNIYIFSERQHSKYFWSLTLLVSVVYIEVEEVDHCKLEASLVCRPSFRKAKENQRGGLSKNKTRTNYSGFFLMRKRHDLSSPNVCRTLIRKASWILLLSFDSFYLSLDCVSFLGSESRTNVILKCSLRNYFIIKCLWSVIFQGWLQRLRWWWNLSTCISGCLGSHCIDWLSLEPQIYETRSTYKVSWSSKTRIT